jgi:phosphatidylinositol-3,4,5-trisphosphate 3-phosphatase and dual-specificity protein phosphatase PTEN
LAKATDTLIYYGMSRTQNGKVKFLFWNKFQGVTIPSQIRYIHYFEEMLNMGLEVMPIKPARIDKIRFITMPNLNVFGGCTPYYRIKSNKLVYNSRVSAKTFIFYFEF